MEVLLFKVLERRGGGWHPVTGGVEKKETFFEGAQREVLEETGYAERDGQWFDLEFSYRFQGRFGEAEEHAFGLILTGTRKDPVIDSSEHTAFEWVSLKEAQDRVQFESQRDALQRFSCYFEGA
jgi:8-oxo-dGTP pyrophosphatase MutT (NUDIX family)